uniref:DDRGK domain-containing protein 1 n=1 Tax=Glossina morsitans morsitans TaxID=37546 RepID=A0A1B0FIB8_GLOMM
MDLNILIGIASALLVILLTLYFLQRKKSKQDAEKSHLHHRPQNQRNQEAIPRRAQIARNQRNRLRQNAAVNAHVDENDSEGDGEMAADMPKGQILDEKMGAKKRAKIEAKEQKKLMREQELKQREERKVKEAKLEEERKKQDEQEAAEQRKQAEIERLAREEQERKELEEYLKMKEAFSVEEEGFGEGDDEEKNNLLADFIKYIQDNKVVVLEDLAIEFKLKTQQAIDRIQELQSNGTLTGVIDDRGKFIYISEDELMSVAKFIKQRGRVSITELAESSNNLIHLTPLASSD